LASRVNSEKSFLGAILEPSPKVKPSEAHPARHKPPTGYWYDPEDTGPDPSNSDSNKGIVNNRYETYDPLIDAMK
jgi:hypothetical protein